MPEAPVNMEAIQDRMREIEGRRWRNLSIVSYLREALRLATPGEFETHPSWGDIHAALAMAEEEHARVYHETWTEYMSLREQQFQGGTVHAV
jgi:hypothetical protein